MHACTSGGHLQQRVQDLHKARVLAGRCRSPEVAAQQHDRMQQLDGVQHASRCAEAGLAESLLGPYVACVRMTLRITALNLELTKPEF